MLTAACTPPYNIVLFETKNIPNDTAVKLLSDELKSLKIKVPGVLAQQNLAHRFSQNYAENDNFHLHVSMNIMQLDEVFDVKKSPGFCRELNENDLFYMPYWERAFEEDCKLNLSTLQKRFHKINQRIGKNTHYIWENQHPVACCVNHRNTENGAGIGFVYTPPHYRGNGYATSVVAELSQNLLERGNKFCFLFADAANPISCGIYRKIGFKDLCVVDQIHFNF
ncbi:MAG: GNAT family N-acetyltransferase [Oscillospiraceae bacterium]|nr:GNAT family N-acetyltransferase [Oscillospiraceae bacterium]